MGELENPLQHEQNKVSNLLASLDTGYNKHSGNSVALKKMKFTTVSKGLQAALLREASVMSKMANASVVRLYDSFQDDIFLYLVMEYSPLGDLEGYIEKKQGKFDLAEASHIIRELSNGLRFLRSQSIVHRDLKPANILLFNKSAMSQESKDFPSRNADLACKLTDFTMARRLDDGELAKTVCGSPLYMAPEVLNRRNYTDKADLWSVGVILYRLIFNNMPFNGLNEMDLRDNLNHKPVPIPQNDPRLTPELLDLLTGLLQKDPFLRIDWEEFFMHAFLRPPRLGSTILTDESLDLTLSHFGADSLTSDLTSITARDAVELRTQIRDYENRLQSAQNQVKLLLGELEQSQLRELLKDQQLQGQIPGLPQPAAPQSPPPTESAPTSSSGGSSSSNPKVDHHKGTIKFSEPAVSPSSTGSGSLPESFTSSAYGNSSSGATPADPTKAAASLVRQKLQRLGASHIDTETQTSSDSTHNSSNSSTTTSNSTANSTSTEGLKPRSVTSDHTPAPNGTAKSPSSNDSAAVNARHRENGDVASSPEALAAQSSIQLLLSQIHPDRGVAIDIVQQLLAEVLVSPNEVLDSVSLEASAHKSKVDAFSKDPDTASSAPLSTASRLPPASSPVLAPAATAPTATAKKSSAARNATPSSASPVPISVASSSAPPYDDNRARKETASPIYGATAEELVAWEEERKALASEGDEWRQLFSQLTNDYDNVTAQLSEAKTMVTVLQDDLKERDDKLATYSRLEQEYTRTAIYLEDQLRGSRERVSYLEGEFKALDDYRKQVQQQQRRN